MSLRNTENPLEHSVMIWAKERGENAKNSNSLFFEKKLSSFGQFTVPMHLKTTFPQLYGSDQTRVMVNL